MMPAVGPQWALELYINKNIRKFVCVCFCVLKWMSMTPRALDKPKIIQ
jgi:hypothetical protein